MLMLDDRPAALQAGGFADEWRLWLRLSNLLGARLASDTAVITTVGLAAAPAPHQEPSVTSGSDAPDVPPEWAPLLVDATPSELELLLELSVVSGIPVPTMGLELADGIPVSFAWPESRIVVDLEFDDRDRLGLEAAGWTVVTADAASLAQILAPAR